MATEFKLNYTGSEINRKLETVDAIRDSLEHNYYTSTEIDSTIDEVNSNINNKYEAVNASLERSLANKASLIDGKVPVEQLPLDNKADLVDGKVPLEQLPDNIGSGSGGGVTSWNDLEDKPFYESKAFEDIEWDGNTEGLPTVSLDMDGAKFEWCKLSDIVLEKENCIGATINYSYEDEDMSEVIDSFDSIYEVGSNGSFMLGDVDIFCITQNNDIIDLNDIIGIEGFLTFAEAGLWVGKISMDEYVLKQLTSFTSPSTIVPIDPKFIPANLDFNLDDYYTKSEIDNIVGDCNTILDEIGVLIGA